jgi:hypothetical protein
MSPSESARGAEAAAGDTSVAAPASSPGGERGRTLVFLRAPMLDSAHEVAAWLADRGFGRIATFPGPDGSCRGSGVKTLSDHERATTFTEQESVR